MITTYLHFVCDAYTFLQPSLFDHMVSKEELVKETSQQREKPGASDKKQVVPLDDIKGIFSPHQLEKVSILMQNLASDKHTGAKVS